MRPDTAKAPADTLAMLDAALARADRYGRIQYARVAKGQVVDYAAIGSTFEDDADFVVLPHSFATPGVVFCDDSRGFVHPFDEARRLLANDAPEALCSCGHVAGSMNCSNMSAEAHGGGTLALPPSEANR
ncbi:MAG: hypothetical protein JWM87_774 [Candidatus Eremiobacteraeota bacterium]|nr:hypothetical protein [Candidatus Eremiobacteraeota bacterium]